MEKNQLHRYIHNTDPAVHTFVLRHTLSVFTGFFQ